MKDNHWDKIISDEIEKNGVPKADFATKHGIPTTTFYRTLRRVQGKKPIQKRPKSQKKGIEAFRNQYDDGIIIPAKIEAAVEKHLQGADGAPCWMRDREFRELCGVSVSKWRRHADEFKGLQVVAQGEVVWGHPDIIEEMRRAVNK